MTSFRIAIIFVFLLSAQLATAQKCPTFNKKCNPLSALKLTNIPREIATALTGVNSSMTLESYYDTDPTACMNTRCKFDPKKQAAYDAALKLADAFQNAIADGADAYLESIASGCPTQSVLDGWVNVVKLWANGAGFLGTLSIQGEVEVDWKLSVIGAGYVKMKPYLDANTITIVEKWIKALYGQAVLRPNRSDNNHWAWHLSGLIWASVATNQPDLVTLHTNQLVAHMNNKTTINGVIKCEKRCTMTAHYHQFYLQAFLTGMTGHKVYFGALPSSYTISLRSRVRTTWTLINTFPGGYNAMAAFFNYTSATSCSVSKFTKIAPNFLSLVNALYQYVSAPSLTFVATCEAISSYVGRLRYFKFLTGSVRTPDLSDLCCNPFCGVTSVVRTLPQCATKVG